MKHYEALLLAYTILPFLLIIGIPIAWHWIKDPDYPVELLLKLSRAIKIKLPNIRKKTIFSSRYVQNHVYNGEFMKLRKKLDKMEKKIRKTEKTLKANKKQRRMNDFP